MLLLAAADLADSNALVAIAGAAATALTTLSGVLVSQMSGVRAELAALAKQMLDAGHKHERELRELRETSARADGELAARLDALEEEFTPPPARRKTTGAQSTTQGRRPVTRPR